MTRTPKTIAFWCGRLPHWEVEDGRYFVTIHLAGAIPTQGRVRLRQVAGQFRRAAEHDEPERLRIQRKIFVEMELWLDRCQWCPHLARTDIAEMVASAIDHRHERGDWRMFEYVVMPTHVHLFCEAGNQGLKQALEDFKRWTGRQGAKLLGMDRQRFWQREWFDHWSRSDDEDERIIAYIRNNPVKAGLVRAYTEWRYGSWQLRPAGPDPAGNR